MLAYYSHCVSLYGTRQEERDVKELRRMGFAVDNPNNAGVSSKCAELRARGTDSGLIMEIVFKPLSQDCDVLAFRALPDGMIPAGVAKEIAWAVEANKPVIELPSGYSRRVLSVEATREYLKEVGHR